MRTKTTNKKAPAAKAKTTKNSAKPKAVAKTKTSVKAEVAQENKPVTQVMQTQEKMANSENSCGKCECALMSCARSMFSKLTDFVKNLFK